MLVAASDCRLALLLAVFADRVVRGATSVQDAADLAVRGRARRGGILWLFLLSPAIGIVTYALRGFGVDWNYYINADQALLLIVIAAMWKQISYNFLFFLAGLQSIPHSLVEAAAIDGAGPARRFWTIVFPLLSPTAFFLLVVNVVYAFFDTFAIVDATTRAAPRGDARSWCSRSTRTASRRWTSAVRRPSRWS